uniref:Uncharacterized protein n=1 Tax=Rhizophora mucronata TaxID=61149 RepID=A0A2P2NHQ3_RHIMU
MRVCFFPLFFGNILTVNQIKG